LIAVKQVSQFISNGIIKHIIYFTRLSLQQYLLPQVKVTS